MRDGPEHSPPWALAWRRSARRERATRPVEIGANEVSVSGHGARATKELFIRWAEWSALSPVFRLHGSINAGTHTPWTYDRKTLRIYKRLSRLHMRARMLFMRLWRKGERTGTPPTRPLWLAYPDDPQAAEQDQEWLLGPNVLVAPVVEEGRSGARSTSPRAAGGEPGGTRATRAWGASSSRRRSGAFCGSPAAG